MGAGRKTLAEKSFFSFFFFFLFWGSSPADVIILNFWAPIAVVAVSGGSGSDIWVAILEWQRVSDICFRVAVRVVAVRVAGW